jgi:uncharacterized protein YdeI (YjbR/CyaY-like superfamily)
LAKPLKKYVRPNEMHSPKLAFSNQEAWEAWLEANGEAVPSVWLRIAKRSAEQSTVSYTQALESALCYGWIDGQKQAESEHYWLQRFTPRTAKSIWSKINKAKAEAPLTLEQAAQRGWYEAQSIFSESPAAPRRYLVSHFFALTLRDC